MWEDWVVHVLEHHRGKVIGVLLALLASVLVVTYGFWKALFIITCIVVGYLVGKSIDESGTVDAWMNRVLGKK
ncbi:MAG: DUF2273 domain-containing protein [Syntrophomonadaceae bacterium]|jgi:uncharacterized membrane protein|nr:DUF2273 domain-containing protein [Syntrophomonadaceae bacterium]MDH7498063.1 DUF2273 domain-containing protein [Syntrophomonadaceae bacterium]